MILGFIAREIIDKLSAADSSLAIDWDFSLRSSFLRANLQGLRLLLLRLLFPLGDERADVSLSLCLAIWPQFFPLPNPLSLFPLTPPFDVLALSASCRPRQSCMYRLVEFAF